MPNEIIPAFPSGAASITNIGKNTENNINMTDCNVTFNIEASCENEAAKLLAIRNFSREYYQIIVTRADIFDSEEHGSVYMATSRALIKGTVPSEIYEKCSSLTDEGKAMLKTFPAIIAREKIGKHYAQVDPEHLAIYGYVRKIINDRRDIKIYYRPINLIPLRILCENPLDYGVDVSCALSDFNVSHWIVRKVNLFDAFRDTGLGHLATFF